jgi:uncharacterized protein (DUF2147 family)
MQFKRLSRIELICGLALAAAVVAGPAARGQQARPAIAPAPTGPAGLWIDHTGRAAVEILPCAEALCGRIVWLKEPNDKAGRPLRDGNNEERAKRSQPICGLQILGNLKLQSDGSWDNGWIYDPEQGERFDVELRLRSPDALQVKGYKGLKFLSETYQWKRATAPPGPLCAS